MTEYNWMSREEWAKCQRSIFADQENPFAPSGALTTYATASELRQATGELKVVLGATRSRDG
jgi:hypothetical protein